MKKPNSVISTHQRKPTRPWTSSLSHDNRLRRCFFHFPSSDFCLHDQHQLVIIVFYFKHGIKEMCYKDQMWLSQLSSSDIMWHHKPPTVSLLPLDTPRSWLKMVYKQNTCWKRGQRAQKKGALIKRSFSVCVCVWSMIGRIPQKIWKHCEWLTSLLITEQPIMLGFGSSAPPLRIYSDHGN